MFFAYQYHTKESFLTISDDIYGFKENVSSGVSFTSTNFITFGYLVSAVASFASDIWNEAKCSFSAGTAPTQKANIKDDFSYTKQIFNSKIF